MISRPITTMVWSFECLLDMRAAFSSERWRLTKRIIQVVFGNGCEIFFDVGFEIPLSFCL